MDTLIDNTSNLTIVRSEPKGPDVKKEYSTNNFNPDNTFYGNNSIKSTVPNNIPQAISDELREKYSKKNTNG